jgi:hypothetical protein
MTIMKNKLFLAVAISALVLSFAGCSASFSTGNGSTNAAKPAETTAIPATKTNSNTTANSIAAKNDTPKTALADEKKPEGTAKMANKSVPVPADWIYVYDENKGYGFSVPAGTTSENDTQDGTDIFIAETPAPSELAIAVLSFKDQKMTKDDLLKFAEEFIKGLGATKVEIGKLTGESVDYSVTEAVATLPDGSKSKSKILVGTDVTDNYVMLIGTEEPKFAANEKVIDEIWGSFEMWSGGASGGK